MPSAGDKREKRPRATALEQAVRYLSRRTVSEQRLREYLSRKGYGEDDIGKAVERLKEKKYLSDKDLARARAGALLKRSGYWGRAIRHKLREEGIGKEDAAEAERAVGQEEDPKQLARGLVERRYGANWQETPRRRVASFLERRGFSPDVIVPILRELKSPPEGEESGE
ncbi:MAG: regulatory protein RecX [Bdellovibrionota bacterium]